MGMIMRERGIEGLSRFSKREKANRRQPKNLEGAVQWKISFEVDPGV